MLKIALCDDIPEHNDHLLSLLESQMSSPVETAVFSSPSKLLDALGAQQSFDLFFLDVELGEENGVDLAREINRILPSAQIVFVTSNLVNAVQVGEANHIYFLVKPVEPDKLRRALSRALQTLQAQTDKRVAVQLKNGGDAYVPVGQIIYCVRNLRVTTMVCTNTTLVTPLSLIALEEVLPKTMFARPHNSFLVNLMHVVRVDWLHVYLDNDVAVSLTNHNRAAFRDALAAYVSH